MSVVSNIPASLLPFVIAASVGENLTCRQVAVLAAIAAEPGLSVKEYAAALEVPKPAISRACGKMIETDWLTRSANKSDRRQVRLFLTERGKNVLAQIAGA